TVARGIAQYDSVEVRERLAEREARRAAGTAVGQGRPLVHADDLVAV
ncbi:glutamate 5-kinase, partial [Dietzia aerolata]|nr:glutamate 5-kinase [Dietzia aerolata]